MRHNRRFMLNPLALAARVYSQIPTLQDAIVTTPPLNPTEQADALLAAERAFGLTARIRASHMATLLHQLLATKAMVDPASELSDAVSNAVNEHDAALTAHRKELEAIEEGGRPTVKLADANDIISEWPIALLTVTDRPGGQHQVEATMLAPGLPAGEHAVWLGPTLEAYQDCLRFNLLVDDHDRPEVRSAVRQLLRRMPTMTTAAVRQAADHILQNELPMGDGWVGRLHTEASELSERLGDLRAFLRMTLLEHVGAEPYALLLKQETLMSDLLTVLAQRLKLAEAKEEGGTRG